MSNNKKISALREGIGRLTASLDDQWKMIEYLKGKHYEVNMAEYCAKLKTIELLGGDWKRDENGRHKVFIAGVTCEVYDED